MKIGKYIRGDKEQQPCVKKGAGWEQRKKSFTFLPTFCENTDRWVWLEHVWKVPVVDTIHKVKYNDFYEIT